ncbi:SNARE domain protein [Penicillium argentinense]|uniref:SNARE domain protein n=1 Tax=Penicillium argentinense TaxID=1131581 RepID=A0A9W9G0Y5_9EURO|nr:SNARE domain protein [Penicillium argentinense]KAJ5110037.1 SNARE domain protein [Penicillium argentinense]
MSNYAYTRDLESGPTIDGYELEDRATFQAVFEKRRLINDELTIIKQNQDYLRPAQQAVLDATTSTEDFIANQRMSTLDSDISESFKQIRGLIAELKAIPNSSDPRVQEQINIISQNVKVQMNEYRKEQLDFEKKLRSQVRRRYEISRPEATPEEIDAGVENVIAGGEQIFMVQGVRSQQATDARNAVQQRSAAIRKIEQDLTALSELFQEVAELVEKHEYQVKTIDENAKSAEDNLANANEKLSLAIRSARAAKKWKWWILLVVVLIIAIIVAVCVAWCKVTNHC